MDRIPLLDGWTFSADNSPAVPVVLPHDAMLHQGRSADAPALGHQGFFLGGSYRYERCLNASEAWREQRIVLEIEGCYRRAHVFLNGHELAFSDNGFLPIRVELGDALRFGEANSLVVTCDNAQQPDARWYMGAGLFRPVWLWLGPHDSVAPWEVGVATISIEPARVRLTGPARCRFEVVDGSEVVASGSGPFVDVVIPDAHLWSAEDPYLYRLRVHAGGNTTEQQFGIRTVTATPRGLFVNGHETLLRGGCVHHDAGVLGAATYDETELRRVAILKRWGYNAIRAGHCPASRALLDACDQLGMYVMDEVWDTWYRHKTEHDYADVWPERHMDDLAALVERDRNHPSVIMYSIGNEVSEPAEPQGLAAAHEMIDFLHREDPTRPVTCGTNLTIINAASAGASGRSPIDSALRFVRKRFGGMSSTLFNMVASKMGTRMNDAANSKGADAATSPFLDLLDIAGYNYASGRYVREGALHPDRVLVGSETFPGDIAKNWDMVRRLPYLIGDFMWTAWGYIGEAGVGTWSYTSDGRTFQKPYPWLLSDTGAIDICGNENAEAFLANAAWELDQAPHIAVRPLNHDVRPTKMVWRATNALPSWSWSGCMGKRATVEVYTHAPMVRLMCGEHTVAVKTVNRCKATFSVRYTAEPLCAIALDRKGNELARSTLCAATPHASLAVIPEATTVTPGQIVYVDVQIADENGIVESNADRAVTLEVEGGELLGFGSANPRSDESFLDATATTYYGRALAVVRAGATGAVQLTATDTQGTCATAHIVTRAK